MERAVFDATSRAEDRHWWFRGRRRIIAEALHRLELPANPKVLEAGCGSGGNLPMLAQLGQVSGFELDAGQLERARARGIGTIERGSIPDEIPFAGQRFDLIVMLDVLEHLEDDHAGLAAVVSRLAPGGWFLASIPAYPLLWSSHDVSHHHFRRYTRGQVVRLLQSAGLTGVTISSFNMFLFPAVAAGRLWQRATGLGHSLGLDVPPAPVNGLLEQLFASERYLLRRGSLPVGASLLAIGRKTG